MNIKITKHIHGHDHIVRSESQMDFWERVREDSVRDWESTIRGSSTKWKGKAKTMNRAELTHPSSQDVVKRANPNVNVLKHLVYTLLSLQVRRKEAPDAQQWFSNLLHTGNTPGAWKTTIVWAPFSESNLIGMNEAWVFGILKAPQLILTCSKVWEPQGQKLNDTSAIMQIQNV